MLTAWIARFARPPEHEGTPVGINLALGAVIVTVAAFLADWLPVADPLGRCAVIAAGIGGFAVFTTDPRAVAMLLLPTWLVMNGFVVNRLGELTWHGSADVYRLLALAGSGVAGLALGALAAHLRDQRACWRLGALSQSMFSAKETSRSA
jgi:MFS family permease